MKKMMKEKKYLEDMKESENNIIKKR